MVARGQGATSFLVECRDFAAKSLARACSALGIEGETQQTIDVVEIFEMAMAQEENYWASR